MIPHRSDPIRRAGTHEFRLRQEQTNHQNGDNSILGRPTVEADQTNIRQLARYR